MTGRVEFVTDRGVTVPAVDAEEMREVDRIAVEETGPGLVQMMENAGRSLASVVIDRLGRAWRAASVLVLAGTGGNGGGGITAARHLRNRGVAVEIVLTSAQRLGEVPAKQLSTFRAAGGTVTGLAKARQPDLIVDAVIGYGLRSAPHGVAARLIEKANTGGVPVISLDVPSGVDATTGATPGVAVAPDVTVTLALPKTGLAVAPVGDVLLADLGIPATVYERIGRSLAAPVFDERWVVPLAVAGPAPLRP